MQISSGKSDKENREAALPLTENRVSRVGLSDNILKKKAAVSASLRF
jgi:hypothetical protein